MTEWIWVVSNDSARVMSGRIPGRRRASMDLPEPGGPDMSTLWPPAAAISKARFTCSWPFTSAKSGPVWTASPGCQGGAGEMGSSPVRCRASWATSRRG